MNRHSRSPCCRYESGWSGSNTNNKLTSRNKLRFSNSSHVPIHYSLWVSSVLPDQSFMNETDAPLFVLNNMSPSGFLNISSDWRGSLLECIMWLTWQPLQISSVVDVTDILNIYSGSWMPTVADVTAILNISSGWRVSHLECLERLTWQPSWISPVVDVVAILNISSSWRGRYLEYIQ